MGRMEHHSSNSFFNFYRTLLFFTSLIIFGCLTFIFIKLVILPPQATSLPRSPDAVNYEGPQDIDPSPNPVVKYDGPSDINPPPEELPEDGDGDDDGITGGDEAPPSPQAASGQASEAAPPPSGDSPEPNTKSPKKKRERGHPAKNQTPGGSGTVSEPSSSGSGPQTLPPTHLTPVLPVKVLKNAYYDHGAFSVRAHCFSSDRMCTGVLSLYSRRIKLHGRVVPRKLMGRPTTFEITPDQTETLRVRPQELEPKRAAYRRQISHYSKGNDLRLVAVATAKPENKRIVREIKVIHEN